ncbi:FAD-binding protein [Pontixanthobacter aquaemixtae]|uniref:FAD-binding protein n=1 Tax=Pontixanthobacter aquaemixtae TaxID=1958940 RepID=A0A844ZQ71_9SPHN|nr:FAD-binding protein [Pontixanthobacter aquaemixtae]MXO89913.1 FAD-binding protein [Pontixanthobacter aquaemixtae]
MKPDHTFIEDLTPTSTRVEPADIVADPDAASWDDECDVLVVGVGMAGVCAALRAAEDPDLSVIAIDRGPGGGASKLSGGVIYMGGGTKAQREAGVEDAPDNMARYLSFETGDIVSPETVSRFAKASAHFQDWLEKYGARFGGPATDEKTSYPNSHSLYYSGNELTVPGRERATPAPRGHRAKPPEGGEPTKLSGEYLLPPLLASLDRAANAKVLRQARATRLIADANGNVIGVELKQIKPGFASWKHGKAWGLANNIIAATLGLTGKIYGTIIKAEQEHVETKRIRVRKGVVLSAGGFTYNREMMAKTAPDYLKSHPLGTIADDGSGIKLGMSVGAKTDHLDRISAWKFLYQPENWVKSCAIGPDGKRLVGEEYYGARTGEAVFGKAGGRGWMILDEPLQQLVVEEIGSMKKMLFQKIQFRATLKDYTVSAPTLPALAELLDVPASELEATIAEYNGYIERGEPDPLGKSEKYRRKIESGPFYATDIGGSLKVSPIPALTMGGLVVEEETGQVSNTDGAPIGGLYAAGRTAVGICSHYYVSGLSLGDCVFSGMRAAEAIRGNGGSAALI